MVTVYLDNCCYNRPFDDRSNIKNYLEREAILLIMQMAYDGNLCVYGSEVLQKEMSQISNYDKRKNVEGLYQSIISDTITINEEIVSRAKIIMEQSSIKAFDSMHLASAEQSADVLLTTDAKFLKAANRIKTRVHVKDPVMFILEVVESEYNN